MMQNKWQNNFYTTYKGVNLYIDYTSERLKILNFSCLSENTIWDIIKYAKQEKLGKIIINCRIQFLDYFLACGFVIEGIIKGYFLGEDATCMAFFIDEKRKKSAMEEDQNRIIDYCLSNANSFALIGNRSYTIRRAVKNDIPQMIELFSIVFETYPSPVFCSNYLQNIMQEQVLFKVAEEQGKIISIASADRDRINLNAEITDCATYSEYRGRNIISEIIYSLEADLKADGFITAYSLSRAKNIGINKTLNKLGYKYSGRLLNNCHISGGYEDMNVWVKDLGKDIQNH